MTFSVQATGSFTDAAPSHVTAPATRSHTYRVLAPTPAAAEAVACQLLVADQAKVGMKPSGTLDAAAAG